MHYINKEKLEEVQRDNDISFGPYEESKMTAGQLLSCLEVADEEVEEVPEQEERDRYRKALQDISGMYPVGKNASYMICIAKQALGINN